MLAWLWRLGRCLVPFVLVHQLLEGREPQAFVFRYFWNDRLPTGWADGWPIKPFPKRTGVQLIILSLVSFLLRNWRTACDIPTMSGWLIGAGRGPADLVGDAPVWGPDDRKDGRAYRVISGPSDWVGGSSTLRRGSQLIV